jgi:hypothetical protein
MAKFTTAEDPEDPVGGAHALYLDYCEAVDEGRFEDFGALWCKDGTISPPSGPEGTVGRELVSSWLRNGMAEFVASQHLVSHIRVRPAEPDGVPITGYVYAMHQRGDGSVVEVWGRYQSRMRFEDGRWRFASHTTLLAGERPFGSVIKQGWPRMRPVAEG